MLYSFIKGIIVIVIIAYLGLILWPLASENRLTLVADHLVALNRRGEALNLYKYILSRRGLNDSIALYSYADMLLNAVRQNPQIGYDEGYLADVGEVVYYLEQDVLRHPRSLFSWSYLTQFYEAGGATTYFERALNKMVSLSPERYSE